jgi:hypothetical protein
VSPRASLTPAERCAVELKLERWTLRAAAIDTMRAMGGSPREYVHARKLLDWLVVEPRR